ncbi:MAG: hypothetical protein FJX78_09760 [Armatimonadetes bacterium]|nr:hypothetical protein [Armatimonadota bacterium]
MDEPRSGLATPTGQVGGRRAQRRAAASPVLARETEASLMMRVRADLTRIVVAFVIAAAGGLALRFGLK